MNEQIDIHKWFKWVQDTSDYKGNGTGEITYPVNSLVSEVGEITKLLVRHMRKRGGDPILNRKDLPPKVVEKLGLEAYDVLHCLAFLINELGLDFNDIVRMGEAKLLKRIESGSTLASNRFGENSLIGRTVTYLDCPVLVMAESIESVRVHVKKENQHLLFGATELVETAGVAIAKFDWEGSDFCIERSLFYKNLTDIE